MNRPSRRLAAQCSTKRSRPDAEAAGSGSGSGRVIAGGPWELGARSPCSVNEMLTACLNRLLRRADTALHRGRVGVRCRALRRAPHPETLLHVLRRGVRMTVESSCPVAVQSRETTTGPPKRGAATTSISDRRHFHDPLHGRNPGWDAAST